MIGSRRFVAVLALLTTSSLRAQSSTAPTKGDIAGSVTNAAGKVPIADVDVALVGSKRSSRSDEKGQFLITGVTPGTHILVARKPGFSPESLSVSLDSGAVQVHFALREAVQSLDEVLVAATPPASARLEGFELRRQRRNGGRFITRADIERRGSTRVSDVLRGVQGIKMVDSAGVTLAISSRSPKVNMLSRQIVVNCVVRVGVDGGLKESGFPVDAIPTRDVHGIEVYSASTIPPEFNTSRPDAFCGLIMIWTRSY